MSVSLRSQRWILWLGIVFAVIYGLAVLLLIDMIPPPDATMSEAQIGAWYAERHDSIRIGAMISAWTSGFMVPIGVVMTLQVARLERGRAWTLMCAAGTWLMSIPLVLPPIFWGVAAYTKDRSPEVTSIMHELGTLTFVTTDQYYIYAWIAVAVISFLPTAVPHSPFPRWFGYLTIWAAFMFEAGAIAFLPRTGPFAWDGVLVLWSPVLIFSAYMIVLCFQLFKAISAQASAGEDTPRPA